MGMGLVAEGQAPSTSKHPSFLRLFLYFSTVSPPLHSLSASSSAFIEILPFLSAWYSGLTPRSAPKGLAEGRGGGSRERARRPHTLQAQSPQLLEPLPERGHKIFLPLDSSTARCLYFPE